MANSKKWSEQTLTEQSLKVQENGEEIFKTQRVLQVCTSGMSCYRKHFIEDKYKGKNYLALPFDMVVLAGNPCPEGKFYEMEYTIGSKPGFIYRALIQAVNPVTDIRLVIGKLIAGNILSKEFYPRKAWLRGDIDMVCVGSCHDDPKEGPVFSYSAHEATDSDISILDFALGSDWNNGVRDVCIYYYRGDCREVWLSGRDKFDTPDIMVCGSDNVNDPAFEQQREADMQELRDHLDDIQVICNDYSLPYFMFVAGDKVMGNGKLSALFSANMNKNDIYDTIHGLFNIQDKE